jgi:hypothetical protein
MITANPFSAATFAGQPSRGRVVGSTPGLDTSSCFICSCDAIGRRCGLRDRMLQVRSLSGAPTIYALLAQLVAGSSLKRSSVAVRIRQRVPQLWDKKIDSVMNLNCN